jgi:hypothetical protein
MHPVLILAILLFAQGCRAAVPSKATGLSLTIKDSSGLNVRLNAQADAAKIYRAILSSGADIESKQLAAAGLLSAEPLKEPLPLERFCIKLRPNNDPYRVISVRPVPGQTQGVPMLIHIGKRRLLLMMSEGFDQEEVYRRMCNEIDSTPVSPSLFVLSVSPWPQG